MNSSRSGHRRPTFGTAPFAVADDARFDGDDGRDRCFFVTLLVWADDYGRFDGSVRAFARLVNAEPQWVEERFKALVARGAVAFYEVEQQGVKRTIGEIIGFHEYPGHPPRRAFPSKRGAGRYPDRQGHTPEARRMRARREVARSTAA